MGPVFVGTLSSHLAFVPIQSVSNSRRNLIWPRGRIILLYGAATIAAVTNSFELSMDSYLTLPKDDSLPDLAPSDLSILDHMCRSILREQHLRGVYTPTCRQHGQQRLKKDSKLKRRSNFMVNRLNATVGKGASISHIKWRTRLHI